MRNTKQSDGAVKMTQKNYSSEISPNCSVYKMHKEEAEKRKLSSIRVS